MPAEYPPHAGQAPAATAPRDRPDPRTEQGKFTTGSTMRHVVVMTATGSVGLVAVFAVDALNLFYIAQLGEEELAAAIGFAGTLLFFTISLAIGITIAATAVTSRALGRGDRAEARRLAGTSLLYMLVGTLALVLLAYPFIPDLLALIGARGRTADVAAGFMRIVLPSVPLLALGMCMSGILRAVGDASRAMYVTLGAGFAAALLDPLFIFVFDLGVTGAAISTVLSRFVLLGIGLYGCVRVHDLLAVPHRADVVRTLKPFLVIALPAVATQLATPVGNAYVTGAIASFGDSAVAGWAIVGRLMPVAFGAVFALSGSVGPILGQNYGVGDRARVNQTMRDALTFGLLYVLAVWAVLAILRHPIADLFGATGDARDLVLFFCGWVAGTFVFTGALFVANAAFNNLGYALYATAFNWGRATLGIVPFVWFGSRYGPEGALLGWGLGAVVFGVLAVIVCFRSIRTLPMDGDTNTSYDRAAEARPTAHSPFTSGKGAA